MPGIAIGFLIGLYWTAVVIRPPIEKTQTETPQVKSEDFSARPRISFDRDGFVRENR